LQQRIKEQNDKWHAYLLSMDQNRVIL